MNNKKIILDLCGGTGAWSKPYKEAGYDVRNITLPDYDIKYAQFTNDFITFLNLKEESALTINKKEIYGILAAPPCTMFSFARTNAQKPRDLKEGMECVRSCLDIIWRCIEVTQETNTKKVSLKFWALENPSRGLLKNFIGKPDFIFNPYNFGDMYKKETALWGNFKEPVMREEKNPFNKGEEPPKFDYMKSKDIHPEAFGKLTRQERRSITPAGFAKAFFKANQ